MDMGNYAIQTYLGVLVRLEYAELLVLPGVLEA